MTTSRRLTAEQSTSDSSHVSRLDSAQGVYITVHGHFYQPPRENPYLEKIERQPGAAPFHNWNARINAESYRPNAFARVCDDRGDIVEIVNNFEYFSFNIGPTLLNWLREHDPAVYERIRAGDRASESRLGKGNAIAQVYNHIILPLANERDKRTQIRWGKADFRRHFGRDPEGMWLAETAVDLSTVEALIDEGIRFIILAPSQAKACRPMADGADGQADWQDVGESQIDPRRPYRCRGTHGHLDIFFYDGPISSSMGFDDVLASSGALAHRLGQAVDLGEDQGEELGGLPPAQLISVATDGETFGHHKKGTEKCLAYAFVQEFPRRDWTVTNYAHYLQINPPTWEVRLKPVTAWSCAHGVGRWKSDCGCAQSPGYNQQWREPLRNSLDWLRDQLGKLYEEEAGILLSSPWAARDAYVDVIHDRSQVNPFLDQVGRHPLSSTERSRVLCLLEMQRHALLMYTSCGWFFEEISRPEGIQILRYAARAMELAHGVSGSDLEPEFMARLAQAPSNLAEYENGADLYRKKVQPSRVSMAQIVAHHAMDGMNNRWPSMANQVPGALSSLSNSTQQRYCYDIETLDEQRQWLGSTRLAVGQLKVRSQLTQESGRYVFAVLHTGGLDFYCRVMPWGDGLPYEAKYQHLKQQLLAVDLGNLSQLVLTLAQALDKGEAFDLSDLFGEERQRIMASLSRQTSRQLDQLYGQVYRDNAALLMAFRRDGNDAPLELIVAAQVALTQQVRNGVRAMVRDWQARSQLSPVGLSQLANLEGTASTVAQLGCELTAPDLPVMVAELLALLMDPMVKAWSGDDDESFAAEVHLQPFVRLLLLSQQQLGLVLNVEPLQERLFEVLQLRSVSRWSKPMRDLARALGLAVPHSFG